MTRPGPVWMSRHRVACAVALTLLWYLLLFVTAEVMPPLGAGLHYVLVNLVTAALPLTLAWWYGWWQGAALGWRTPQRSWLLAVPLPVVSLTYLLDGVQGTATALLGSAVLCLSIGLSEEALSRGVVQHLLRASGPARAAAMVGALFGAGHVLSRLWFGAAATEALWVGFSAGTFGFAYAALRWHLGTIWPLVVLHALEDFTQLNSPGAMPFGVQVAYSVGYLGYGWWLLRRLDSDRSRSSIFARTSTASG